MLKTYLTSHQISVVLPILEELRRDAGIELDSPDAEQICSLIMRLYWAGHHTTDDLRAAVHSEIWLQNEPRAA